MSCLPPALGSGAASSTPTVFRWEQILRFGYTPDGTRRYAPLDNSENENTSITAGSVYRFFCRSGRLLCVVCWSDEPNAFTVGNNTVTFHTNGNTTPLASRGPVNMSATATRYTFDFSTGSGVNSFAATDRVHIGVTGDSTDPTTIRLGVLWELDA